MNKYLYSQSLALVFSIIYFSRKQNTLETIDIQKTRIIVPLNLSLLLNYFLISKF